MTRRIQNIALCIRLRVWTINKKKMILFQNSLILVQDENGSNKTTTLISIIEPHLFLNQNLIMPFRTLEGKSKAGNY